MKLLGLCFLGLCAGWIGFGCSGSVVEDDGSGGQTSASAATTSAASTAHTATAGTTVTTGTSGSGCDSDMDCIKGDACIHSDELCGKGVKGACQVETFPPCAATPKACLCNGTVSVACGTVDISKDPTSCSQGTFDCGGLQCKKYVEYCVPPQASPAGGGPDQGCLPAPAACTYGIADCSCVSNGGSCQDDRQGGVTYMLPVP
jgi:hypothetical protein